MTTAAPPRRRYPEAGLPLLPTRTGRGAIQLPSRNDATLLPDPKAGLKRLVATLRDATSSGPSLSLLPRQIRLAANFITFALLNDLPAIDPYDAAVIKEKWRRSLREVSNLMRGLDEDVVYPALTSSVLDAHAWDVAESLATALAQPRAVFNNYCPWRADWATFERIHPEAT